MIAKQFSGEKVQVKREETEVGLNESELLVNNTVSSVDRATCEEGNLITITWCS